jgi:hypothetical protein
MMDIEKYLSDAMDRRRRTRALKGLAVSEISSVDAGANPYAKVLFMKREESSEMSDHYQCPNCGHTGPVGAFQMSKAAAIHKAAAMTFDTIVRKVMQENPGMSLVQAKNAAGNHPDMKELVRKEWDARFAIHGAG